MTGSSWAVSVLGRQLALGFEFVAQVVEGVVFTVCMGAEGGPGRGDQVVQVGQGAGQAGAEPADLRVQQRDRVECPGERAHGRNSVVVPAGHLLKISVRVVPGVGRDDHLLRSWCSALARQGVDDCGHGGADLGREAGGGQKEAEQHTDHPVPGLEPGVSVQEPHHDAEHQDE